ncbi:MAG: DsbA family protein [Desulfobacterium sp.]|nr:DsbA family protein [Desulfobacterium sp.]
MLLAYAKAFGKQTQLAIRLFEAFFSEGKDISDWQILARELQTVGLNGQGALAKLDDESVRERTQTQEAHWHGLGVSSVPTMVLNRSDFLKGAQPVKVYQQVLDGLYKKMK